MQNHGFTLLELLVTLTIMSLIMMVGLPSLSQQIQNNRTETAALELFGAIQLARNTAVRSNSRATLRKLGSWQDGWEVFDDNNRNGTREPDERLLVQQQAPLKAHIHANGPISTYVSFVGTGESKKMNGAFQAGTFTICPTGTGPGYELVLSRGGRTRMSKISNPSCQSA